jgi:hypothetical protein
MSQEGDPEIVMVAPDIICIANQRSKKFMRLCCVRSQCYEYWYGYTRDYYCTV